MIRKWHGWRWFVTELFLRRFTLQTICGRWHFLRQRLLYELTKTERAKDSPRFLVNVMSRPLTWRIWRCLALRFNLNGTTLQLSLSFWPERVDISYLSTWVDGSNLSNPWEVAWIYKGWVKISDLSTWVDGSDLSTPWPIDKLSADII